MAMVNGGTSQQKPGVGAAELKLLTEFFPIGKELRYTPNLQLVVVLDTIIVAYRVNDHLIYSRNAIQTDGNGSPAAIAVGAEKTELPADQFRQIQLLVPDTSDMEGTLDYDRRAIIGRTQFQPGNAITLLANAGVKGVASLRTQVTEQIVLKEGPYAGSKMVLLNPEFETFGITEQMHRTRGKTHVPVALYFKKDEPPYPCTLSDFSESAVGLHSLDGQHNMPPMEQDHAVTIVIDLGEAAKTYTIKGRILRRSTDACVVRLEELFRDHEFSRFNLLDSLKLKTSLLNYGN